MTDPDPTPTAADPLPGVTVTGLPGLTADRPAEPDPGVAAEPPVAESSETVAAAPGEPNPVAEPALVADVVTADPVADTPAAVTPEVRAVVASEPAAIEPTVAEVEPEPVPVPRIEDERDAVAGLPPKLAGGIGMAALAQAIDEAVGKPATPPPAEAEPAPDAAPTPLPAEPESNKKWYVIKVTSGREESIKAAVERKVRIEGLEEYFGQIAIPVERVTEVKKVKVTDKKTGEKVTQEKRVVKERKKFHGYIFAEVEYNDRILYLFRETSGVGDFVGATITRAPTPMTDREVQSMLSQTPEALGKEKKATKAVVKLDFEKGDKVRIRDGAFANSEGEVKLITEPKDPTDTPKVTVVVTIWGRPVDVEVDFWQVDKV